jgi:3-methylcrotonyl-CoA carboxylase beta subunit
VKHFGVAQTYPCDVTTSKEPHFDSYDLYSLIPAERKKPFPIREVLARILDDSELDEFKAQYGTSLICGFARIMGQKVGVIANDGILFSESALKGTHFIQLCCQRNIPLVFFQNIVGFMVGRAYEHGGIAKDGAKLVTAVSCASVPKYTVIVGGSFGAGNYGMAGRAYQPRFLFSWPNSRISVMGPEQAASVLTQVKLEALQQKGKEWPESEVAAYRNDIESRYSAQADPYYATARLWDDGIIDPKDTRRVLGIALAVGRYSPPEPVRFGTFRT